MERPGPHRPLRPLRRPRLNLTPATATPDPTATPTGGFTLTATGHKVKRNQKADLEWAGATSTDGEVYGDSALLVATENDEFYTDNIDQKGWGSYSYQICEEGTTTCSNESTITF